jgi:carbamate kinase
MDGMTRRRPLAASVPSPEPRQIVQLGAIEQLLDAGLIVVCAPGGGVPVVQDAQGRLSASTGS